MVIYLNQDGSAQKVVPERIFQGTNNVIAIYRALRAFIKMIDDRLKQYGGKRNE